MSLKEKLSKISNEIKENKEIENKKLQDKELEPIRSKIKELEETKFQLELLLGSLKLKSGQESGTGMREYSAETNNKFKRENSQLSELISENKEVLKSIGVEDKDQLLENPDFAEDKEIISYKKSKKQKEGLDLSDSALRDRLSAFGINIDQENFSYDQAEKVLEEKIKHTKDELIHEKAKTPEGKEELKEELIQYFNEKIPSFSFSEGKYFYDYNKNYVLNLGDYNNIEFNENKISRGDTPGSFSMGEWGELEKKYPYDVIRGAMKEIFDKRVASASYSSDISGSHNSETEELKKFKEMIKSKFLPMAENMINTRLRIDELRYKAKMEDLGNINSIKDIENIIKNIESDKEEAEKTFSEIVKIETGLPDEEIILIGNSIEVPSFSLKYDEFRKETKEKGRRLKEVMREIEKLETSKPKVFGKEKWNNSLGSFKKEKIELEKRTDYKSCQEKNNELYGKAYIYIPIGKYSHVGKIVKEQPRIRGNSKEIFKDLKVELNKIVNKKVPESVSKLYKEFSDLIEKK